MPAVYDPEQLDDKERTVEKGARSPEDLKQAEQPHEPHEQQVGSGYTGPGKPQKSRLRGLIKTRNRKLLAVGGLLVIIAGLSIAVFLALLPLKILHIMNNLQSRFYSTSEAAVQKETDTMISSYLKRYVLKQMSPKTCKGKLSTINRTCKVVVPGNGLISNMYRGWANGKLEADLADKFGLEIEKRASGYWLKAPSLGTPATGVDVTDFATGSVDNIWDSKGFKNVTRNEVRNVFHEAYQGETYFKRVMYRIKVGRLLEEKYGIKRCIFFCGLRDNFADWKDAKGRDLRKIAAKIVYNQRVLSSAGDMWQKAIFCLLTPGCDPITIDSANSIDTNKVTPKGCAAGCEMNGNPFSDPELDIQKILLADAAKYGDRKAAQQIYEEIEKNGWLKTFSDRISKTVEKDVLESEGEDALRHNQTAIDYLKKYLAIIGLLYNINFFLELTQKAAPALQKFAYVINSSTAIDMFSMYRTYADELKEGKVDATMVGSMTDLLNSGTHCDPRPGETCDAQVGGIAEAEGSPVYGALFGSHSSQSTYSPDYKCRDNKPVPVNSPVCPDLTVNQSSTILDALKGLKTAFGPLAKVLLPLLKPLIDAINWFFHILATVIGDLLGPLLKAALEAIAFIVKPLVSWVGYFVQKVILWMVKPLQIVTGEMSGGRSFDITALGADASGNDFAHHGLGGQLLDNSQLTAILDEQQQEENVRFSHQSFFAKLFDTQSNNSLITKLAMAVPTKPSDAINNAFASLVSRPFSKLVKSFSGMFSKPALAFAGDPLMCEGGMKGDCFGVTQYGYPENDPVFTADPEGYWDTMCSDSSANRAWNELSAATLNPDSYMPENKTTNPCLLLQSTAASAGAVFTTDVLTPQEDLTGGSAP